ncbi:MAG: TonB-dependent receptor [Halieaceae bacterium]|jgi:outer membrane receptor for ferrienterochelin and colicins|nr:TonB-dependent receptor [Halieaceae bacterium]
MRRWFRPEIEVTTVARLCSFLCLSFCLSAFGQDSENADLFTLSLEELMTVAVVTAVSKRSESASEAPSVVSIMSAQEIALFGGRNLGEVLARMLGVQTHNTWVNGRNFIGMRSDQPAVADNSHVLILLNGSAWAQDSYNGGIFNNANSASLPVDSIERIEFIRGPGSVLHGSKAFQGVINIITKASKGKAAGLTIGRGQMDTHYYEAEGSYKQGDLKLTLNAMSVDTDGPELTWSVEEASNRQTAEMNEDNVGVLLTAEYQQFAATFWYGESKQASMRRDLTDLDNTKPVRGFWNNEKYFANLAYTSELNKHWQLTSKIALNGHRSEISLWGEQRGPNVEYESDDQSFEINLNGVSGGKTNYLLGALVTRRTGATPGEVSTVPDWQEVWWSAYGQIDHQPTESIKLTLGGQYNDAEKDHKIVPRLGAIFKFSPEYGMKLLYGEAFRSPENVETHVHIPAINLFGNPDVGPELIKTVDLQFYYHEKSTQAAITFFRSDQEDLITRYVRDDGNISFRNEGSVVIKGVEVEAKTTFWKRWFVTAGLSYQSNEDSNGLRNFTLQPNWEGRLGIGYSDSNFSLGLYDIFKTSYQEATLREPSFATVNPSSEAWHNISINLKVNLGRTFNSSALLNSSVQLYVSNLLDETVFLPTLTGEGPSNTMPAEEGRAFFVEFKQAF